MPEGPEVRVAADQLHSLLQGRNLVGLTINAKSRYWKNPMTGLAYFLDSPSTVEEWQCYGVGSHGKKLIFAFRDNVGRTLWLLSSLGLEGRWILSPQKNSGVSLLFGQWDRSVRGFLLRRVDLCLYYDDSRRFGQMIWLSHLNEVNAQLKDVGPDWLSGSITLDRFTKEIRNQRISRWPICKFLMDQKRFSGIGNYLKAEILYAARIRPDRILSTLTDEEITALFEYCRTIPLSSYQQGGHTSRTYLAPNGRVGSYPVKIYRQSVDPHGYRVVSGEMGDGRTSWYVPEVQR